MNGSKKQFFMSDSKYQEESRYLPESGESRGCALAAFSGSWFPRLFIFLILFAALVALAFYASQWKKEVVVRDFVIDGASIISERELILRLNVFRGRNLQDLDTRELKKRIMAVPYLRNAEIGKELNGVVRIQVFERKPVAVTVFNGQGMAIDYDGFLLPERKDFAERFPRLLKISGISRLHIAENGLRQLYRNDLELMRNFLDALSQTDYASLLIGELYLAGNNMAWCRTAQSPARFIVGNDGNYKEKLKKFEIFWQKVVSKKGFDAYETVDLRFRERIFTRDTLSPAEPQNVSL
jgi:cell division protein FtsQ